MWIVQAGTYKQYHLPQLVADPGPAGCNSSSVVFFDPKVLEHLQLSSTWASVVLLSLVAKTCTMALGNIWARLVPTPSIGVLRQSSRALNSDRPTSRHL